MKDEEKPTVTKRNYNDHDTGERYEHPAFGVVCLSRPSGNKTLFDSQFRHQYYISLSIHRASMDRELSRNWIHPFDELIEINMSEVQFAKMVSSIGQGSGTPCTINHIGKVDMPHIAPMDTEQDLHMKEFDANLADIYERLDSLSDEIVQATMSGKLRRTLLSKLSMVRAAADSSLKFVAKSFRESMETTVNEAKIEISSYARMAGIGGHLSLPEKPNDAIESKESEE